MKEETVSSKPKCLNPHCNELNHYGDKYDGYCLECRNAGAGELIDELAAVIAERDRLRAEVERLRTAISDINQNTFETNHGGTMTDETRAALERYRKTNANYEGFLQACLDLADAFAAEHPADDEEQADGAWLESIGADEISDQLSRLRVGTFTIDVTGDTGGAALWLEDQPVADNPTRQQVRDLVKALGGTMKETQHGESKSIRHHAPAMPLV